MSWHYQIVRYTGDNGYGLHDVYSPDGGDVMHERPASFCGVEIGEVITALEMALADAKNRPVVNEEDFT